MADNTEKKQGFQKGQSGNPYGRPKGALNKTTRACQELLNGEAETITRKAIEMAVGGDMTALKLCLERIVPVRKEAPVVVTLPSISRESDLAKFTAALLEAVTKGDITISEAQGLLALAMIHVEKGLDKKDFMGGLGLPWP
ncbi:MAG TPA: DUF5681 domain-containing protein [Oscillospiraceae bacterium]|jgi:hypothetical protein|nr:DUF5681 domain-containing protein [Oscillospiraceae bacterium]